MTDNQKAITAASAAVLSWSTVAAAFKTALSYYTHYEMLTVAAITATVIFAIAITLQRKWSQVRHMHIKDLGALALLGLLSPTFYYLVLFSAYEQLPAQVAQPVNYCWPIFLVCSRGRTCRSGTPADAGLCRSSWRARWPEGRWDSA